MEPSENKPQNRPDPKNRPPAMARALLVWLFLMALAVSLFQIVTQHGGKQEFGWSFDFPHLHAKSGSLSPLKHFAYDLRDIVRRQPLPGYRLTIEQGLGGPEILSFVPTDPDALGIPRRRRRSNSRPGDKL